MKVKREGGHVVLTREKGDQNPKDESHLFYLIRNQLRKEGEDVIKKEMSKDGHMISDNVFYVRSRKPKSAGSYAIYDSRYALRDSAEEYRKNGTVTLSLIDLSE